MGGERSGKSDAMAKEILARLLWCAPQAGGAGRIALCAQEYDSARREMEYIAEGLEVLGALKDKSMPKSGKWIINSLFGTIETISLKDGSHELTSTGDPYDIVGLAEWGLIAEDAMSASLGRTGEQRGVFIASGTLHDTYGWQAELWESLAAVDNIYGGRRFAFPAWENLAIFPGGRNDPEIKRLEVLLPDEEFKRRVGAELVRNPARIYDEFDFARHVGLVPFDPALPVELTVDAGYFPSHYAVLALQVAHESFTTANGSSYRMEVVRQIDEIWENGRTHQDILELAREREWWGNVDVVVGGHETRQHQAAESTQEVWENVCRKMGKEIRFIVVDGGRVLDGVMRVKTLLKDPASEEPRYRCSVECIGTHHEFQTYKRKTDRLGQVRGDEPEDDNNDALDALRNWTIHRFGHVEITRRHPVPGRHRLPARG